MSTAPDSLMPVMMSWRAGQPARCIRIPGRGSREGNVHRSRGGRRDGRGRRLARRRSSPPPRRLYRPTSSDIFSIEPDGRDRSALSPEPGNATVDAISPDGSRVLYRTWSGNEAALEHDVQRLGDVRRRLQQARAVSIHPTARMGRARNPRYIWADAPYAAWRPSSSSVKPMGRTGGSSTGRGRSTSIGLRMTADTPATASPAAS